MATYRRSPALAEWFGPRRANVDGLARALAALRGSGHAGPADGAGPLGDALVLRVTTEFQGFVRDLLDFAAITIVRGSGCAPAFQPQIIAAMSRGRMIDRGNPHLEAIKADLNRLGVAAAGAKLADRNAWHAIDAARLQQLVELRNALAHDDQDRLQTLARQGARPIRQYVMTARASLGRTARALDQVVWDYLAGRFSTDPWSLR